MEVLVDFPNLNVFVPLCICLHVSIHVNFTVCVCVYHNVYVIVCVCTSVCDTVAHYNALSCVNTHYNTPTEEQSQASNKALRDTLRCAYSRTQNACFKLTTALVILYIFRASRSSAKKGFVFEGFAW